jgi:hypothetical protein
MRIDIKKFKKAGWHVDCAMDPKTHEVSTVTIYPDRGNSELYEALNTCFVEYSPLSETEAAPIIDSTLTEVQKFQIMKLID